MSFVTGHGRYARATYPSTGGAAAAATAALRNRNVSVVPAGLTAPFTPVSGAIPSLLAAILFTPKISGVIQATAILSIVNGATPEPYALEMSIDTGTGLSVTGGESSSNGWVVGSNTPPVVGGSGIVSPEQILGICSIELLANGQGTVSVASAISQPVPVGVPVVVKVAIGSTSGTSPLTTLLFSSLSVLELP